MPTVRPASGQLKTEQSAALSFLQGPGPGFMGPLSFPCPPWPPNNSSSVAHLHDALLPALAADYINFMKQVTPETTQEYMTQLKRFNMGAPGESDCPVFDGMYEYFAVGATPTSAAPAVLDPLAPWPVRRCLHGLGTAAAFVCLSKSVGTACVMLGNTLQGNSRAYRWGLIRYAVLPGFHAQLLSGGSVDGAAFLAAGKAEIAFNWAGRHCVWQLWGWHQLQLL